jgi:hypothetical protein
VDYNSLTRPICVSISKAYFNALIDRQTKVISQQIINRKYQTKGMAKE